MVSLCDRFRCLPSQIAAEDTELIRMLRLVDLAEPDDGGGDDAWLMT